MVKAKKKLSRIRITISQSKLLTLRRRRIRRRMRVALCADLLIIGKKCPNHKGRKPQPEQKTVNMVLSSSGGETSGYGNLPYVLSVFQSTTWCLDSGANVHVYSDVSLFSFYQVTRGSSVMMGNG
jgi:hypothetical protein